MTGRMLPFMPLYQVVNAVMPQLCPNFSLTPNAHPPKDEKMGSILIFDDRECMLEVGQRQTLSKVAASPIMEIDCQGKTEYDRSNICSQMAVTAQVA